MNKLWYTIFRANALIAFIGICAFIIGNALGAGLVNAEDESKGPKAPAKAATAAPLAGAAEVEIKLQRHVDQPGRKVLAGHYFSKTATLKCCGVPVSAPETLGERSHLAAINAFWSGYSTNHLTASLFVIVKNPEEGKEALWVEGSLLAKRTENAGRGSYEFSVVPDKVGSSLSDIGDRQNTNFVNIPVEARLNLPDCLAKNEALAVISKNSEKKYMTITQGSLPKFNDPRFDNDHPDRLVLGIMATKPDLFFSLIQQKAGKEHLPTEKFPVLAMGTRYYSTYDTCDTCDTCFREIYNAAGFIAKGLSTYAKEQKFSVATGDQTIPFYTLFYSCMPYHSSNNFDRRSSYSLEWGGVSPLFPTLSVISGSVRDYHFNFEEDRTSGSYRDHRGQKQNLGPAIKASLSKRSSKRVNQLTGDHVLIPQCVYGYVEGFNQDRSPLQYKI